MREPKSRFSTKGDRDGPIRCIRSVDEEVPESKVRKDIHAPCGLPSLTGYDQSKNILDVHVPTSWQIQGTCADIFMSALAIVLDDIEAGMCRLIYHDHDAIWVAVPRESDYTPANAMERAAKDAGVSIPVSTDIWDALPNPLV